MSDDEDSVMQLNPHVEEMTLRELIATITKDIEHMNAMNVKDIAELMDVQLKEQLETGVLLRGKSSAAEAKKAHKDNLKELLRRCKKPNVKSAGRDAALDEVQADLVTLKRWYDIVKTAWPLNAVYVEFKEEIDSDTSTPRKRKRTNV